MAYDAARGWTVHFGGTPDTWEYDDGIWVRHAVAGPSARTGHGLTYDAARGRVVLFGGGARLADTWEYDGADWTQRATATSPPGRSGTALVYDPARRRVVLFGGTGLADTWNYDGTNWAQASPALSPPARFGYAIAYDQARGRVVLFGGSLGGSYLADTWEYIPEFHWRLEDASHFVTHADPRQVSSDPTRLAVPGTTRTGVACDGISQLLVRAVAIAAGDFRVSIDPQPPPASPTEMGAVGAPGQPWTERGTILQSTTALASPTRHEAWMLYRAPLDFVRPSAAVADAAAALRRVSLKVEFRATGTNEWVPAPVEIDLVRPPVVFAHGLWSKSSAWRGGFTPLVANQDPRFSVYNWDYEGNAAGSFVSNAEGVSQAIDVALSQRHGQGYAAAQVDWVGHSMGGILPRAYYRTCVHDYPREWDRPDNFARGDFHKLVLVNSPQHGSPWARVIWGGGPFVRGFLGSLGLPVRAALENLQEGSDALSFLGTTPIPSRALVGTGGHTFLGNANLALQDLALFLRPTGWGATVAIAMRAAGWTVQTGTNAVLRGQPHDVLVLENSQRAGIDSVWTSSALDSWHLGANGSQSYADEVVRALNAPVASFSPFLPPPELNPPELALPQPGTILAGGIAVTSPPATTIVQPGQVIDVTVSGASGYVPVDVDIFSSWTFENAPASPFTGRFTVPPEAAGTVVFAALARNAAGTVASAAPLELQVAQSATLTRLAVDPPWLALRAPLQRFQLRITGVFSDSVERDLTRARTGTTYASSNNQAVSVGGDGMLEALGLGSAVITVRNGSVTVPLDVRVAFGPVVTYGTGLTGSHGRVPAIGTRGQLPILGNSSFAVQVWRVREGAPGCIWLSDGFAMTPAGAGTFWVSLANVLCLPLVVRSSNEEVEGGSAIWRLPLPLDPALVGASAFWQGTFLDPGALGGWSHTGGLATTFIAG